MPQGFSGFIHLGNEKEKRRAIIAPKNCYETGKRE
jgi:hypothetical protein